LSSVYSSQSVIPEDHPSLSGHFPGNPIVPGVLLLEHVAQVLLNWRPELVIVEFPAVKFQLVLRPEQIFEIQLQQKKVDRFSFECTVSGQAIATGTIVTNRSKTLL